MAKMTKRLGIDLGTNSLGWALLDIDLDKEQELAKSDEPDGEYATVVKAGVRIFSDGREPKTGLSLAVARREARGARRMRERRVRRLLKIANFLKNNNLLDKNEDMLKGENGLALNDNPYQLRARAIKEKLSANELGRAIYHLAKRRGFKSNRITDSDDEKEEKGFKGLISKLTSDVKENQTKLGAFFYKLQQERPNMPIRFKPTNQDGYRAERALYEDEFLAIKEIQAPHYPINWDDLYEVIFYQRPLKQGERGECTIPDCKCERSYNAGVSFEKYRFMQDLLSIKGYGNNNQEVEIPLNIIHALFAIHGKKKEFKYTTILKDKLITALGIESFQAYFIKEDNVKNVKGLASRNDMCAIFGEEQWEEFDSDKQNAIVDIAICATDEKILYAKLEELGIDKNLWDKINKFKPASKSVANLCAKHYEEAYQMMRNEGIRADEALDRLGANNQTEREAKANYLPHYNEVLSDICMSVKSGNSTERRIGNPTVHIALLELQKVVNELVAELAEEGEKIDQIVLELNRDLKLGKSAKEEISKINNRNKKERDTAKATLKNELNYARPTTDDIIKWQMWQKQKELCIYCGKAFILNDLDIEHILPYSKTLDDSRKNKALACRPCNARKGDRSPYEAFYSENPQAFKEMQDRAKTSGLYNKFLANSMEKFMDEAKFMQSQITDTAYISRSSLRYLKHIIHRDSIWSNNGRLTEELRRTWDINSFLDSGLRYKLDDKGKETSETFFSDKRTKKNRSDHRHHAIDAMMIALCSRSMIQRVSTLNKYNKKPIFPRLPLNRSNIETIVAGILPSIKTDHSINSALFKETAFGKKMSDKVSIATKNGNKETEFTANDVIVDDVIRAKYEELLQKHYVDICKKDSRLHGIADFDVNAIYKLGKLRRVGYAIKTKAFELAKADIFSENKKIEIRKSEYFVKGKEKEDGSNRNAYTKCIPIRRKNSDVEFKAYAPDGYVCVEIWATPLKKDKDGKQMWDYTGEYISPAMAMDKMADFKKQDENRGKSQSELAKKIRYSDKPHPAAKFVMQLFKKDMVRGKLSQKAIAKIEAEESQNPHFNKERFDKEMSEWVYMETVLLNASGNFITFNPIHASNKLKEWANATTRKNVSLFWRNKAKTADGYQKSISSTLFDDFDKFEKVMLTPLGEVKKYGKKDCKKQ